MAGVVAMASVIEDFDTQPCKKSRRDGGSPVVKTNTNYLPPVPKPVEKPFSPPRYNIMDYFNRKTPSSKEKKNSPEQSKENCLSSAEKHTSPEVGKQPSQKRRKTSKAARKLVAAETVSFSDESSCFIVEDSHESKDGEAIGVGSRGMFGNDMAALMLKISAEDRVTAETSGITNAKTASREQAEREPPEDSSKCENSVQPESALNTTELSPAGSTRSEVKPVKIAPQKARRKQQKEVNHPEEKEAESSQCGAAKEDSLDEASQLNKSTVKISFEDFLRSQNQVNTEEDMKDDKVKEDISKLKEDKVNSEQLNASKDGENVVSLVPSVQISPRTVTIQAEVHAVSPKHKAVKPVGNLASIFNRKKGQSSPAEKVSSPHAETGHQFPSLNVKRRSNVVVQEEDLEVVVLESESTLKCSEKERKQFMAAFKQPSLDGSKTKPVKSQGRSQQAAEKILNAADKAAENDTAVPASFKEVCLENKAAKKKPTNKGRNKAKDKIEAVETSSAATAVEETSTTVVDVEDQSEEPPITSTPSAVRRSRREAVVRQALQPTPTTPVRKTRRQTGSKAAVTSPQDSLLKISTPKTPKSKHGVFVAEIVCSPDVEESPIRIKFSRVHKNVSTSKTDGGNDKCTSITNETSSKSEKRKQAKKLVEKAKVIQQSKKTSVEENTLRRSSRTKTSLKRSYGEDEDSVICMEDLSTTPQSAAEKCKTQKPLRSLNDVLGKATAATKEAKAVPVASLGQEKSARKVSAVISIFDESSQEGSENSQNDEQFRTRREFLKSGLPESFKKQIAKTAANKETYYYSFFHPVTHTTQQNDFPFWSLPWPESSLLSHLKELWSPTSNPLPSVTGSLCVKTVPTCRNCGEKGSGWRQEIPESICQRLMEEFSTSNPHFPAEMHIARLLKRRTDHQQQLTASEQVSVTKDSSSTPSPAESVGGKRKRKDDEAGNLVKVAKKRRSTHLEEDVSVAEPEAPKGGGRTRRAQRSRLEEGVKEKTKSSLKSAPSTSEDDAVVVMDDLIMVEDARKKDVKEDVLWTDKYQPQHSSDIIDNTTSVKKLHSWLKEWKLRADREERKNQKVKKHEEGSNDSDWDCGEEDGEDMCNTMLITGPTGVGKTAAVYACAQELGFKVFEVNASSQRSGRLILSQLKEATQSHQVDSQGVNAHKPTYFNSYGTSSSAGAVRPGSSPRKVHSPHRVVSSPRKNPQSPRGAKKGGLAPISLANFFKMGQPTKKEPPNTKKKEQTAASKKVVKANESGSKKKDPTAEKTTEEQSKKTATSLILFEEVDVIFEDDAGFLAAIKTFMTTTKRPVILTTSDPAFSTVFDGSFDEIHFKTPSVLNAGSYLQLLCLAEDVRTNLSDVSSLLRLNGCDIRQSLLQLQFWARSAGGHYSPKSLMHAGKSGEAETKPETEESADKPMTLLSDLPPCDTGCTESKLGLLNIEPKRDIWELFRSQSLMEETVCWELLTHSRQRGVDLLYSNMEALLALPLTELDTSKPEHCVSLSQEQQPLSTPLQSDALPPTVTSLHTAESADCSDSGSPVKVSSRMKKYKKRHRLPEQDGLHSESDSEDGFPSLCKPQSRPHAEEKVEAYVVSEKFRRKLLTPEERIKSLPVSQCLESIAEFLDNMSYIDSSLLFHPLSRNIHSMSAIIKDGMTDESRVETDGGSWLTQSRVLEVQAAVEALSFHKCQASVAKAWDKVQRLEGELGKEAAAELTLPVAAHRESYSFTQDGPCHPQLIQRRREVMESLMVRGVLGSFDNKPAAALDYLPIMRTICRSEQLKEQGKVKRRFLHYLNAIILGLEKSSLQLLAKDFP